MTTADLDVLTPTDPLVYITGANFHPVPGRYNMPACEGYYQVYPKDGKLHMTMNARGGA